MDPVWDSADPNVGACDVIHAATRCRREAPGGSVLARSRVLVAGRVRGLVLMEMGSSIVYPIP